MEPHGKPTPWSILPTHSFSCTDSTLLSQGQLQFPHLQLCLVFHSMCPRCPRIPAEIMVSTCPHTPLLDEATDHLFLILGPPNFLGVSVGTMWGFSRVQRCLSSGMGPRWASHHASAFWPCWHSHLSGGSSQTLLICDQRNGFCKPYKFLLSIKTFIVTGKWSYYTIILIKFPSDYIYWEFMVQWDQKASCANGMLKPYFLWS